MRIRHNGNILGRKEYGPSEINEHPSKKGGHGKVKKERSTAPLMESKNQRLAGKCTAKFKKKGGGWEKNHGARHTSCKKLHSE